jgi:DNA-binding CsgD family transcriptional regulator/tetratricopeptide (TPR) repeat protein
MGVGALDLPAVERFVAHAAGHDLDAPLRSLAAGLAERSGGNAFYLGELWRHLQSTGAIDGAAVPDSVREVVEARLGRLGDGARDVVELVATAGLRVDARVLRAAYLDRSALDPALDELLDAKLLVEVAGPPVTYQFTHALVRDAIEQQASVAGRAERHRRIAAAIEDVHEPDRRPVLAELARHHVAAAPLGDAERAVHYARLAATQAMRSNAEEEAIVHLEAARRLSPPGTAEHVQLLVDLGTCRLHVSPDAAAAEAHEAARAAALELGLVRQMAIAVLGLADVHQLRGESAPMSLVMVRDALELLRVVDRDVDRDVDQDVDQDDDEHDEADLLLRARLRTAEAQQLHLLGRQDEATAVVRANVAEARRSGIPTVVAAALGGSTIYLDARHYLETTLEGCDLAERIGDSWLYCALGGGLVRAYLQQGDVGRARAWVERLRDVSARARYGMWRYQVASFDSLLALVLGDFDAAERLAAAAAEVFADQPDFVAGVHSMQMYAVRREQGRLAEVLPLLRIAAAMDGDGLWRPGLAALLAQVGMRDEARATFEALAADGFASVPRDAMWPTCLVFLSEVCVALGDRDRAGTLYGALEEYAGYTLSAPFAACFGPADRLRGSLVALMGRPDEARAHFVDALALAQRSGSPVWLARVHHDWAVALGERLDLLEAARATASRLGMADVERTARAALAAVPERAAALSSPPLSSASSSRTSAPRLPDGLSARELEVLRLVAAGRSNRTIGEALFISPNTVANHVRSILQKTGCANRAEASAYAARRDLL